MEPNRKVDVIITTTKNNKTQLQNCIEHAKGSMPPTIKWDILVSDGPTWESSMNDALRERKKQGFNGDILILHDDTFLTNKKWYDVFFNNYNKADIFGFKLIFPDMKTIQNYGASLYQIPNKKDTVTLMTDYYKFSVSCLASSRVRNVCHIPHSCVFIKAKVFDEIGGYNTNSFKVGYRYADADFNFRALMSGFKLKVFPVGAMHFEGYTIKKDERWKAKVQHNWNVLRNKWFNDDELYNLIENRYGIIRIDRTFNKYKLGVIQ